MTAARGSPDGGNFRPPGDAGIALPLWAASSFFLFSFLPSRPGLLFVLSLSPVPSFFLPSFFFFILADACASWDSFHKRGRPGASKLDPRSER